MEVILAFGLAFFFSFTGSIPPGTINLTVLQLSLENKVAVGWRLALAAALIEYPYAWIAVSFEKLITSSPVIVENLHLITAIVMTVLGIMNIRAAEKPTQFTQKFHASGFRRGIMLGVLNPLAIPYWIGVTAYVRSQGWVSLMDMLPLQAYLIGVSVGALCILVVLLYLGKRIAIGFQHNKIVKKIPGYILLGLGLYSLVKYLLA